MGEPRLTGITQGDPYDALAPYYRTYAAERSAYLAAVDSFVCENMPAARGSLLDVGSGDGVRAMALARTCGIARVVLSDSSAAMAERCRALSPAAVWAVPAQDLPETEHFDVVTCLWNVLGHVPGRAARLAALTRMRHVLSPRGRLFVDVQNRHNAASYGTWRVLGRVLLDAAWPDERRGDTSYDWRIGDKTLRGHGHLFTPREIGGLLRAAGLRPLRRVAVDYTTGACSANRLKGQLAFVCEAV